MKLGVMSDTHGRQSLVHRALVRLREAGVNALVHCGDVGGLEILEEFAGWRCWFVWGNNDWPEQTWRPTVAALGLTWPEGPLEITLAGKHIAICHGHELQFQRFMEQARHDYLLCGHTHHRADERVGHMRVINPGALHRVSIPTVAVLDLAADDLRFLQVV